MSIERALSYSILLSPMLLILVAILGAGLSLRWHGTGVTCAFVAILAFAALATPLVSEALMDCLEGQGLADSKVGPSPSAIVVLSGDAAHIGSLDADVRLGRLSLERVYFAAEQYRATPLPLLVTGGRIAGTRRTFADLMAETLSTTFAVPVRWREARAETTFESAKYCSEILKKEGISTILVVTQEWHMARTILAFARFGIRAIPTKFADENRRRPFAIDNLVPSVTALIDSTYAIHEILGIAYYRFFSPQ